MKARNTRMRARFGPESMRFLGHAFVTDLPRPSHILLRSTAAVVVVSLAAATLGVVAALAPSWLLSVDRPISEALRSVGATGAWRLATSLGGTYLAVAFALATAVLTWNRCRAMALALPVVVGVAIGGELLLKLIVDRPRPLGPLVGTALGSFPSGHVIRAVVVFGLLPPVTWILGARRWAFWLSVGAALVAVPLVAVSRIVLGAHWPSDVAASLLIGAALLLLAEYFVGSGWASRRCGSCRMHLGGIGAAGGAAGSASVARDG